MPNLKPSQWAAAIGIAAGALGGSSALVGALNGAGTLGLEIGLAITEVGLVANALAPYLASISD